VNIIKMEQITLLIIIACAFFGVIVALLAFLRVVPQYTRGVKLTFGRYSGLMEPGLNFIVPIVQTYELVDIRQRTIDMPPQEVMTKDNVNLKIDGVVFYNVINPKDAFLNVSDLRSQIEDKATSELKEVLSTRTMSEALSQRENIANELMKKLEGAVNDEDAPNDKTKAWGVTIKSVQINNIELPKELTRAMAKQAEAEREKEARKTKAVGEEEASKKFEEAAQIYNRNPAALRLRELQTFQEIGVEHNSLMIVIPSSMSSGNANWTIPLGRQEMTEQENKARKEQLQKNRNRLECK